MITWLYSPTAAHPRLCGRQDVYISVTAIPRPSYESTSVLRKGPDLCVGKYSAGKSTRFTIATVQRPIPTLFQSDEKRKDVRWRGCHDPRETYLRGVSIFGKRCIGCVRGSRNSYRVFGFEQEATKFSNLSVAARQSRWKWESRVLKPVQIIEALQ